MREALKKENINNLEQVAGMNNSDIKQLIELYNQYMDEDYANWSQNYLRNKFQFLGIRTPIRRKLTKQFLNECGVPSKENLKEIILTLWNLPEREYQKAALDILEKVKKELMPDDMPWLCSLLVTKSWWDTVDVLSPHIMGYLFTAYPQLISSYADEWILNNNIWLQRSALLYQLRYRKQTDEDRLFHYIHTRADSNEFFIQKAIGWALREYGKTNPDAVKEFVTTNQLKPLSKREALKRL